MFFASIFSIFFVTAHSFHFVQSLFEVCLIQVLYDFFSSDAINTLDWFIHLPLHLQVLDRRFLTMRSASHPCANHCHRKPISQSATMPKRVR